MPDYRRINRERLIETEKLIKDEKLSALLNFLVSCLEPATEAGESERCEHGIKIVPGYVECPKPSKSDHHKLCGCEQSKPSQDTPKEWCCCNKEKDIICDLHYVPRYKTMMPKNTPEPSKCNNCGKETTLELKLCTGCGYKLGVIRDEGIEKPSRLDEIREEHPYFCKARCDECYLLSQLDTAVAALEEIANWTFYWEREREAE